jgi:molybdopterin-guanine dinucleotide biosynthesis protein A
LLSEGPAGLLLTGGASTRMGRDKATLPLGPAGMTLGRHLGSMLEAVTVVALEVGPHASLLDQPTERDPGEGPLAAIALGTRTLRHLGFEGPVLVLATDLPCLSPELLSRIALWPAAGHRSVVPVAGGRLQPLCARWSPAALDRAIECVEQGKRRVNAAFGTGDDLVVLDGKELAGIDLDLELSDVDDEGALERLGLELPAEPPSTGGGV